jgi:hypothetical protein
MSNDKADKPTDRELALMQAFASTMRTMMDPIADRLTALEQGKPAPKATSPDEVHAQMMRELRGKTVDPIAIGLVEVVEHCTSDSGATFDAECQYTPVHVDGKLAGKTGAPVVKCLLNYTWPVGHDVHQQDGGLVPNGMAMVEDGKPSPTYRQWLWETYLQADTRRFVGKPLPRWVLPEPAPVAAVK